MVLRLRTMRDLRDKGLPVYDEQQVLANSQREWMKGALWERDDP